LTLFYWKICCWLRDG